MEEELGCLDMYFLFTEKFALSSVVFMLFKHFSAHNHSQFQLLTITLL